MVQKRKGAKGAEPTPKLLPMQVLQSSGACYRDSKILRIRKYSSPSLPLKTGVFFGSRINRGGLKERVCFWPDSTDAFCSLLKGRTSSVFSSSLQPPSPPQLYNFKKLVSLLPPHRSLRDVGRVTSSLRVPSAPCPFLCRGQADSASSLPSSSLLLHPTPLPSVFNCNHHPLPPSNLPGPRSSCSSPRPSSLSPSPPSRSPFLSLDLPELSSVLEE